MVKIAKKIFQKLGADSPYALRVDFSDGTVYKNRTAPTRWDVHIVFRRRRAEFSLVTQGSIGLMESFIRGDVDIEEPGSITILVRMATNAGLQDLMWWNPIIVAKRLITTASTNNVLPGQIRGNLFSHYNLPARFFSLILDEDDYGYGYTEGYYARGYGHDVGQAQHDKFDYICSKLRLEPGLKMVEVGGGWGYLATLAAKKYGVHIVDYNIIPEQNRVMRQILKRHGVQDKVTIVEREHLQLVEEPDTYDRYVSIGAYEHAGRAYQEDWIRSIAVSLKPGGIGLLSSMGYMQEKPTNYLLRKYIFPGGDLPSIAKTLEFMEKHNLTVLDVENLWAHLQQTATTWARNFNARWDAIQSLDPEIFTDRFRRIWRMYLEACSEGFSEEWSQLNLVHITFTKGRDRTYYPATRAFLYSKEKPDSRHAKLREID